MCKLQQSLFHRCVNYNQKSFIKFDLELPKGRKGYEIRSSKNQAHFHKTLFSSKLENERNKLECYITFSQKGLPLAKDSNLLVQFCKLLRKWMLWIRPQVSILKKIVENLHTIFCKLDHSITVK
jgi:hypothetical protein